MSTSFASSSPRALSRTLPARNSSVRWGVFFLLLGLAGLLFWGAAAQNTQDALAGQVLRLHVIANSDSAGDQSLKLQVRDRILDELGGLLAGIKDPRTAQTRITEALSKLGEAGADEVRRQGYAYPVTAVLGDFDFPTRDYGSFSLPAGEYTAVRVVIGDGGGQNWWCVVFPPLCMDAVTGTADVSALGLDEGSAALITPDGDGEYSYRFRSVELWQQFKALFS